MSVNVRAEFTYGAYMPIENKGKTFRNKVFSFLTDCFWHISKSMCKIEKARLMFLLVLISKELKFPVTHLLSKICYLLVYRLLSLLMFMRNGIFDTCPSSQNLHTLKILSFCVKGIVRWRSLVDFTHVKHEDQTI